MSATVQTIVDYMEELAPASLALPGDPVGIQIGDPGAPVQTVLVALDMDGQTLKQAVARKAAMVVTHHPLFLEPLQSLHYNHPQGALVMDIVKHGISVFCAHSNLDIAPFGVSYLLAELVGLSARGRRVIEVTGSDQLLKLVVFVPAGHEDALREALAGAGAGWIGGYSHCTFQSRGSGTFMPLEGTDPYIGSQGRLETVDELRLETILPASKRAAVTRAMIEAHPYEEVAYDLYPLENRGEEVGLGLIGDLEEPFNLAQLLQCVGKKLKLGALRYWAPEKKQFRKIAVCAGSGGSLVEAAAGRGAELFISGDFRYHDFRKAQSLGIGLVDAGHCGTEKPLVGYLESYLRDRLSGDGHGTGVVAADSPQSGWRIFTGQVD